MPFGNFWNRKKSQDPQPPEKLREAEEFKEANPPESSISEGPGGGEGSNGDRGDSGDDQPHDPPKGGWRWLKGALSKTRQWLKTDIRDLFKSEGRLVDEAFLEELFALLVKSDMGAPVARQIRDRVQKDYRGRKVDQEELLETLRQELRDTMQKERSPLAQATSGTTVILVVGVNGSGKTTSIAKLANGCCLGQGIPSAPLQSNSSRFGLIGSDAISSWEIREAIRLQSLIARACRPETASTMSAFLIPQEDCRPKST
jgi:fused signal recognition particle receptor